MLVGEVVNFNTDIGIKLFNNGVVWSHTLQLSQSV